MRPLNLIEKLILNASDGTGSVELGSTILLNVDWVLASELSWAGMDKEYNAVGRPKLPRPERFWLAADHIVHPSINHVPKVAKFIAAAERISREQPIDYHGPNETIMHTEFVRGRAEPGQIIVGADSHSCSAGCLGALAMGLGSTDTVLALITQRTFLQVPEVLSLRLVGIPPPGLGGKDVILYILGLLKRNTVAAERAVEISGPGLAHLSIDARFAICNMMTEFGALTGVCVPDALTMEYVNRRDNTAFTSNSICFKPDDGCTYAETYIIDLSQVSSLVALYPSPDNTTTAKEVENGQGLKLDGCFIGACTTAYEDLVLAALVLELALSDGMTPVGRGHRKVTPGSRKIVQSLEQAGLSDVYRKAGFDINVPGCSYCVGLGADKAKEGEVWLSSQNRNFKNRMGTGSFGNLASAATVAISSFDMVVRDPEPWLHRIDRRRFARLCGGGNMDLMFDPVYKEPSPVKSVQSTTPDSRNTLKSLAPISGKVQRFGDDVDTDAISPGDLLMKAAEAETLEEAGEVCFYHERPDYRFKVKAGYDILVAGKGFGCGSSRETAATAIKGCGTKAIIAKSYAFIFRRNTANNAIPALIVTEESFYEALDSIGPEAVVNIDFDQASISISTLPNVWPYVMSAIDSDLLRKGGAMKAYECFGLAMYD